MNSRIHQPTNIIFSGLDFSYSLDFFSFFDFLYILFFKIEAYGYLEIPFRIVWD